MVAFPTNLPSTVGKLRKAMKPALVRFCEDTAAILSVIGRPWLHSEAKVLSKNLIVQKA